MKAKMNFLATTVPHHNNIVNFVGAITEGNSWAYVKLLNSPIYAMFTPASDWAATVASERERKI